MRVGLVLFVVAACSPDKPSPDVPVDGSADVADAAPPSNPMHGDPANDVPEFHALLDELEGWGTGTTGGIAGTVFVVDTLADDGPRSLRAALTSDDPHWIIFAVDGTIELADTLSPSSSKTVDARGRNIHIKGAPDHGLTAFKIVGQSNLVFTNLVLDDELPVWDQDAEGADAMTIINSHHIWIHHCSFARWLDGAVDIRHDTAQPGELSHHISVTWNHFGRVFQALNWTADRISFGHNRCDQVRRRCIQIIAGKAHSYDNVIGNWDSAPIQNAKDAAQLFSQRNMFVPGITPNVNSRVNGGLIRNLDNHAFGSVVFLGGNDALDATFETESQSLARIETCTDINCWNQRRALIEATAGVE